MTVSTTGNRINHIADGVKVDFDFVFKTLDPDHIKVYEDGVLTLNAVVVTLNANQDISPGGSINLTPVVASPIVVTVMREEDITQDVDYTTGSNFPSSSHELALDRLVLKVQQLNDRLDRGIIANRAEDLTGISLEIPDKVTRASKTLAFDASGNLIVI